MTLTRSFFTTWVGIPRGFLWTRNCVVTFGLAIAWLPLDSQLRGYLWTCNCVATFGLAIAWLPFGFIFLVLYSWFYIPGFVFLVLYSKFQITGCIFQALYSRIGNALAASALLRGLALDCFIFLVLYSWFYILGFIFLALYSWIYIPGANLRTENIQQGKRNSNS